MCINWGQKSAISIPDELPSKEDLEKRFNRTIVETLIPRSVQKHAPVMYPFPDIVKDVGEPGFDMDFMITNIYGSYAEYLVDNNITSEEGKSKAEFLPLTGPEIGINII